MDHEHDLWLFFAGVCLAAHNRSELLSLLPVEECPDAHVKQLLLVLRDGAGNGISDFRAVYDLGGGKVTKEVAGKLRQMARKRLLRACFEPPPSIRCRSDSELFDILRRMVARLERLDTEDTA